MTEPTSSTHDAILVVDSLVRRFGDLTAVDGVSFHIAPGETYGLLGPNGAGKTTTISIACGLLDPDDGTVQVAGQPMSTTSDAARAAIGYVPQDLAIYPDLTARENLAFFARLQGVPKASREGRIAEVLAVTGLADRADDRADEYSGGMKRRLNIGIGLLHEPRLLVLDEPTVGVDPQSRNAILDAVDTLSTAGMAVLYTTHYMEEAERLCDRIGIIDGGRLVAEGTRRELVSRLADAGHVRIEVVGDGEAAASACRQVAGVRTVDVQGGRVDCVVEDAGAIVAPLVAAATGAGVTVAGVDVQEPDLEAVFLHLTGRALRD